MHRYWIVLRASRALRKRKTPRNGLSIQTKRPADSRISPRMVWARCLVLPQTDCTDQPPSARQELTGLRPTAIDRLRNARAGGRTGRFTCAP